MHCARSITLAGPVDLRLTLGHLRRGSGDPTMRVRLDEAWRAQPTPAGAATVRLLVGGRGIDAEAWGPGAEHALEAVPDLVGVGDRPEDFDPNDRLLRDLAGRLRGLRIGRTGAVIDALVPAILEQKVTGREAWAAWRRIVLAWGELAPGPIPLHTPPAPDVLAGLPYYELHRAGVERRRSELIRFVCSRARRIEETTVMRRHEAERRLLSISGIGPWTVAEVAARAWGDPDAVSVGDFHLPHLVSWVLAGEPRGDDEKMLQLLEPYRGQRGRVIRLLEAGASRPPRRGPRMAPRAFRSI